MFKYFSIHKSLKTDKYKNIIVFYGYMGAKLDFRDKKILHELDFNARQPLSQIAKKLKLSRDIVTYKISKFEESKLLLKYYTIIDIAKLGYTAYKNFIRFQYMTEEKEKVFIHYIQSHKNVIYSASYDGRFDIVISIWARNVEELSQTLKEIYTRFGRYIAERQMAAIVRGEYNVRDYLIGKKTPTKRKYFFCQISSLTKVDDINKKILLELGENARFSSVDIAKKLNISTDVIYQRIKKLENSGIIQNYNIVPNEETYPSIHYKILITLHNLLEEKERKLYEYCIQNQHIWYFCTCLGAWNFEIDLDVENQIKFREILHDIKLNFSDIIKEYTILTCYKTHKYNFCPSMPK